MSFKGETPKPRKTHPNHTSIKFSSIVPLELSGQDPLKLSDKELSHGAPNRVGGQAQNRKPPVRITATVEHIERGESYYEVNYTDLSGNDRTKRIGREIFYDSKKVVELLVRAHADLPDDRQAATEVITQALRTKENRQYRVTSRCGWYEDHTFVYPTATFGKLAGELLWDGSNDVDPALGQQRGTIEVWREGMREPVKYSDYLILACSTSLASSLLHVVREDEGALFHLHGEKVKNIRAENTRAKIKSSSGKSLAARAAASTIARCRKSDLVTFAMTERSIEDYCSARNHLGAQFDEEGRALCSGPGPRVKSDQLPYLVASGRGAVRSKKATRDPDLENLSWSLFAISTGENALDDPALRVRRPEGAQVRMICTPVPSGSKGGIFNRVKGSRAQISTKCKHLARQVEETIGSNYGVVAPAYLPKLVNNRVTIAPRARRIVDKFVKRVCADTDPWERRFAEKFGIELAAATFLTEWGIAPWTKGRARRALSRLYRIARSAIVSPEDAKKALLQRLRNALANKRFPRIKKGQVLAPGRAKRAWGATRHLPKVGRVVLVPLSRVKCLTEPQAIVGDVLAKLARDGVVYRASDGKLTRQTMVKGLLGSSRCRYVCFDRAALVA